VFLLQVFPSSDLYISSVVPGSLLVTLYSIRKFAPLAPRDAPVDPTLNVSIFFQSLGSHFCPSLSISDMESCSGASSCPFQDHFLTIIS